MNQNIYYLSIQSTSLAHYLNMAIILPSRFYKNRPSDIQNTSNDYLILSKEKFLNDSTCSIEIILTDNEMKNIIQQNQENIFLYSNPIPISRIKKIYFIDETQKLITLDNINKGTAFISETIISIDKKQDYTYKIEENIDFEYSNELEEKIKLYNQFLGGLAFVRYDMEGKYLKNYFSILSYFNNSIKKLYQNYNNQIYTKYNGAFTSKGDFWSILSPLLYKEISDNDVYHFSKKENVSIKKSNGIFQYQSVNNKDSITYKIAILNTYGEDSSKRKSTNDLINDCKNGKIPTEKIEGISLIFGINNGYSNFRNQYNKKIVKFKMDSLLDYYTIESIFQYILNDTKDNQNFEYIDNIFSDEKLIIDMPLDKDITIKELNEKFQEFQIIFDKKLIEKDKEIEQLQNKLKKVEEYIKQDENIEELGLQDLKKIAKEKKIKGRSKMKKDELIKAIKDYNKNEYIK